jgi:hypothetical protein
MGGSRTGAELGGALRIAILGSIGTAVYRSEVAHAVPADAPAQAAREPPHPGPRVSPARSVRPYGRGAAWSC